MRLNYFCQIETRPSSIKLNTKPLGTQHELEQVFRLLPAFWLVKIHHLWKSLIDRCLTKTGQSVQIIDLKVKLIPHALTANAINCEKSRGRAEWCLVGRHPGEARVTNEVCSRTKRTVIHHHVCPANRLRPSWLQTCECALFDSLHGPHQLSHLSEFSPFLTQ